jgi:hypothetical protein
MEKVYSLASHLIHSNMQLIRTRMKILEFDQVANLVYKYKYYFDRAAESAKQVYGVDYVYKDIFDACELLKNSIYPLHSKGDVYYSVVQYNDLNKKEWIDIAWYTPENGITLADPAERLTRDEATDRLNSMDTGKSILFRIFQKREVKPLLHAR